jgi:hypothetical protein
MFGVMWVFEAASNNAFAVASNSSHLSEAKAAHQKHALDSDDESYALVADTAALLFIMLV